MVAPMQEEIPENGCDVPRCASGGSNTVKATGNAGGQNVGRPTEVEDGLISHYTDIEGGEWLPWPEDRNCAVPADLEPNGGPLQTVNGVALNALRTEAGRTWCCIVGWRHGTVQIAAAALERMKGEAARRIV